MSALLQRPAAPAQRLTTALMALALVLLGVWMAALSINGGGLPTGASRATAEVTGAVAATAAPSVPVAAAHRPPMRVVVMVAAAVALGVAGLLLALTQRGWTDMALAGAGFLWAMVFSLGARGAFAHAQPASPWVLQALLLTAAWLTGWYALRLLQSPASAARPPRLLKALGVVVLAVWALRALGRIDDFTSGWIVPMACLVGATTALVRVVEAARRGGSVLRPAYGAWLVALAGAAVVGCGLHELWTRTVVTVPAEVRTDAWLATRWAVVAVLTVLLGLRFEQLARMLGQLGRSHRSWRRRLRESQRELHDARDRLMLHERSHHHRGQRDRVLREVHDELGHRLLRLQGLAQRHAGEDAPSMQALVDGALIELRMAYESLDPAPRPLADALHQLRDQVVPTLAPERAQLSWAVDPRAAMVVMTQAETLQVLRIVREALEPFQSRAAVAGMLTGEVVAVTLQLDVVDGETGRHLRLRIHDEPAADGGEIPRRLHFQRVQAGSGGSNRLQRQATMLGAQLSLEATPMAAGGSRHHRVELVIPLTTR